MKYMLDTNICIYLLKNKPEAVIKRFIQHDPADICISSITYAELCHGVENSQAKERNYMALMMFLSELSMLMRRRIMVQSAQIYKNRESLLELWIC